MNNGQIVNELEAVVLKYNFIAMEYLKIENFKDSLALLKKAEDILGSDENDVIPTRLKLMGITLNNLGCYYKKHRQPKVALSYLEKALDVEMQIESDNLNLAGSHLNICAVFSSLSRHKEALEHAKEALTLLESIQQEDYSTEKNITLATSLVICYYNVGVEFEYMNKYTDALGYYQIGFDLSRKELGPKHPLTVNLNNTVKKVNLKAKAGERISRSNVRDSRTPLRTVLTGQNNRLPSVSRVRTKETIYNFKNRLATAYEKLRGMSFQAPL
jgi:tetratricopeptide (TPR) repeat protein